MERIETETIAQEVENPETPSKKSFKSWLKKIGVAGFLFFLIKGLVWLAVFFGVGKFFGC